MRLMALLAHHLKHLLQLLLRDRQRDGGDIPRRLASNVSSSVATCPADGIVLAVELDHTGHKFHHVHQRLGIFLGASNGFGRNGNGVAEADAAAGLLMAASRLPFMAPLKFGSGMAPANSDSRHQRDKPESRSLRSVP